MGEACTNTGRAYVQRWVIQCYAVATISVSLVGRLAMINADSLRSSGKNYSNQIPHNNGSTGSIVFMNLFSPNSSPVNRDQRLDVLFGTVVEKKFMTGALLH